MPQIKISVFASLRRFVDGRASVDLEITPGETVGQVLERLGVPQEQTRVVFVDNQATGLDRKLAGGEELAVFPAIGG